MTKQRFKKFSTMVGNIEVVNCTESDIYFNCQKVPYKKGASVQDEIHDGVVYIVGGAELFYEFQRKRVDILTYRFNRELEDYVIEESVFIRDTTDVLERLFNEGADVKDIMTLRYELNRFAYSKVYSLLKSIVKLKPSQFQPMTLTNRIMLDTIMRYKNDINIAYGKKGMK